MSPSWRVVVVDFRPAEPNDRERHQSLDAVKLMHLTILGKSLTNKMLIEEFVIYILLGSSVGAIY